MMLSSQQKQPYPMDFLTKDHDRSAQSNSLVIFTLYSYLVFRLSEQANTLIEPPKSNGKQEKIASPSPKTIITNSNSVFFNTYTLENRNSPLKKYFMKNNRSNSKFLTTEPNSFESPTLILNELSESPTALKRNQLTEQISMHSLNQFSSGISRVDVHKKNKEQNHFFENTKKFQQEKNIEPLSSVESSLRKIKLDSRNCSVASIKSTLSFQNVESCENSPKKSLTKKYSNKLATMLILIRQDKRKDELISLAYKQNEKKDLSHIRIPNKTEVLKLQKNKHREKKQLKILGTNTFDMGPSKYQLLRPSFN